MENHLALQGRRISGADTRPAQPARIPVGCRGEPCVACGGDEDRGACRRCAAEGVDVLIFVAHREEGELAITVFERAAGQRRDQLVLVAIDVLVLVDPNPAKTGEEPLALLVRSLRRQALSAQQRHRLPHHLLEHVAVRALRSSAEARAGQPHGGPWQMRTVAPRASSPIRSARRRRPGRPATEQFPVRAPSALPVLPSCRGTRERRSDHRDSAATACWRRAPTHTASSTTPRLRPCRRRSLSR